MTIRIAGHVCDRPAKGTSSAIRNSKPMVSNMAGPIKPRDLQRSQPHSPGPKPSRPNLRTSSQPPRAIRINGQKWCTQWNSNQPTLSSKKRSPSTMRTIAPTGAECRGPRRSAVARITGLGATVLAIAVLPGIGEAVGVCPPNHDHENHDVDDPFYELAVVHGPDSGNKT